MIERCAIPSDSYHLIWRDLAMRSKRMAAMLVMTMTPVGTAAIAQSVAGDRSRDGQSQPMIPAGDPGNRWGPHAPGGQGGYAGGAPTGSRWGPHAHGGQGGYRSGARAGSRWGPHAHGGQGGYAGTGSHGQH